MYPLLWLSSAFLAGILLAARAHLSWQAWAGLAVACLLLGLVERHIPATQRLRRICPLPVTLVIACLLLGAARWQGDHPALSKLDAAWYIGRGEVTLRGFVNMPAQPDQVSPYFRLTVEELALDDGTAVSQPARGIVQVRLPGGMENLQYGDRVELHGELQTPPDLEDFSYREYLARQNVRALLAGATETRITGRKAGYGLLRALQRLRNHMYTVINTILPQPEAALLNGILLGLDGDLPPGLVEAFQVSGTAHIIAISGFNIALLAGLFMRLFGSLFTRWWALLATILATSGYAMLVGAEPPVVRAAIMGSLALAGRELGRRSSGLNVLVFAAALMTLAKPNLPWDASFQLSFAATLGLTLFADPLEQGFRHVAARWLDKERIKRLAGPVSEYLLITLAAQITTLPMLATHFGRISWVALLANPLVLPAQPALMILGGLAAIGGSIWLPLGKSLAALAWPLAAYTNQMALWFSRFPGAALEINARESAWVWLALGLILALRWQPTRKLLRSQARPGLLLFGVGLFAAAALTNASRLPDGDLHLSVLESGGQAVVLVRSPGGETVLVGAGAPAALDGAFAGYLPPFQRRLQGWILPGAKGLERVPGLLERFEVQFVAASPPLWQTNAGSEAEIALILAGGEAIELREGLAWHSPTGVRLEVLMVDGKDAALLLEWGKFRAVLPGALTLETLSGCRERILMPGLLVLSKANGAGWEDLHAQRVIWLGDDAPQGWDGLVLQSKDQPVEVRTDGTQMWLQASK